MPTPSNYYFENKGWVQDVNPNAFSGALFLAKNDLLNTTGLNRVEWSILDTIKPPAYAYLRRPNAAEYLALKNSGYYDPNTSMILEIRDARKWGTYDENTGTYFYPDNPAPVNSSPSYIAYLPGHHHARPSVPTPPYPRPSAPFHPASPYKRSRGRKGGRSR